MPTYEQQLGDIAAQYRDFADPAAQSKIQKTISDAVGNFKPDYQEIANLEAQVPMAFGQALDANPGFYGQAGFNPSALTQLNSAIGSGATAAAQAQAARNVLAQRQGTLSDITGNLYDQYQAGQNSLLNQANLLQPLYSAEQNRMADENNRQFQLDVLGREQAFNAAQAELDRQLSRESRGGSGSGFTQLEDSMFLNQQPETDARNILQDKIEFIEVPDETPQEVSANMIRQYGPEVLQRFGESPVGKFLGNLFGR